MLASASSFDADFTGKAKVTGNLPDFFEEAYAYHRRGLNIVYKKVIWDVNISEVF